MPEKGRILIVEDDEGLAAYLAEALRAEGYEVHVAHDGGNALAIALDLARARLPIHVILLDLHLPGWRPALPLIPHLRGAHRFAEIVVATGESRAKIMHEAFTEYRVFDFLEKPFELLDLEIAVERACRRSADRQRIARSHQALIARNQELTREIRAAGREVREWRTRHLRSELRRSEHERRCDRLFEVGLELLSAANLDGLLETAVEAMRAMVPSEATVILLRKTFEEMDPFESIPEEELNSLVLLSHRDLDEGMLEDVSRPLAREASASGQTIRLPEGTTGAPFERSAARDLDPALRSILCVPLLDAARGVMGVLQLFNRVPEPDRIAGLEFGDEDVWTIELVAAFLSRGIQRQDEIGLDLLTQVANRRVLRQRTEEEIARRGKPRREGELEAWFAVVDVDRFGKFNKEHGHLRGDQILRTVARGIAGALREHDFIARFGGDEFCLILKRIEDEAAARAVLERIRRAVEELPVPGTKDLEFLTVSVAGTRVCPSDSFESAFDRADRALKRLKQSDDTRNTVAIEPAPC